MSSKYTCAICGKEFIPRIITEKYCSPECRWKAHLIQKREESRRYRAKRRVSHKVVCRICGKEFTTDRANTTVCSKECKYKDKLARDRRCEARKRELGILPPKRVRVRKPKSEKEVKKSEPKPMKVVVADLNIDKVIAFMQLSPERRRANFDKLTKKEKDYAKKLFLQDGYSC